MPNENLRGGYGVREACGSENLMLGALLAGFGKANARAPTVAGLVWPRHKTNYVIQKLSSSRSCTIDPQSSLFTLDETDYDSYILLEAYSQFFKSCIPEAQYHWEVQRLVHDRSPPGGMLLKFCHSRLGVLFINTAHCFKCIPEATGQVLYY